MRTVNPFIILLILMTMTCACGNTNQYGWTVAASPTLDTDALKQHQAQHPERWKAAFQYLKDTDLDSLPLGEQEIMGREVYAIVSQYAPKEEAACNFEAHRNYIDLQYLIQGKEKIGVTTLDKLVPICDYDKEKDILFFKPDAAATYEVATPDVFYVFFPKDPHRPSIKVTGGGTVKKIVLKIKM